jgi:hypothetical protein
MASTVRGGFFHRSDMFSRARSMSAGSVSSMTVTSAPGVTTEILAGDRLAVGKCRTLMVTIASASAARARSDDVPVVRIDTVHVEFVAGSWLDERARERGAHRADGVETETCGVDVGVIGEDVAFDLGEDQLAPHDVVGVECRERQQEVTQRWRVEHARVEHDASGDRHDQR